MENYDQCPTCERRASHAPAIRVIEYATELRKAYLDAYEIVDRIKKQWKTGG